MYLLPKTIFLYRKDKARKMPISSQIAMIFTLISFECNAMPPYPTKDSPASLAQPPFINWAEKWTWVRSHPRAPRPPWSPPWQRWGRLPWSEETVWTPCENNTFCVQMWKPKPFINITLPWLCSPGTPWSLQYLPQKGTHFPHCCLTNLESRKGCESLPHSRPRDRTQLISISEGIDLPTLMSIRSKGIVLSMSSSWPSTSKLR